MQKDKLIEKWDVAINNYKLWAISDALPLEAAQAPSPSAC